MRWAAMRMLRVAAFSIRVETAPASRLHCLSCCFALDVGETASARLEPWRL